MTPECRKSCEVHTSYEYREGRRKKEREKERKKDRMRHFPKKIFRKESE